jgi:Ca2+-binding RTX toxin-like protein
VDGLSGGTWSSWSLSILESTLEDPPARNGDDSVLVGGAGNDLIIGGVGRNLMTGGSGHDHVAEHGAANSPDAFPGLGESVALDKFFSSVGGDLAEMLSGWEPGGLAARRTVAGGAGGTPAGAGGAT